MARLQDTIVRFRAYRKRWETMLDGKSGGWRVPAGSPAGPAAERETPGWLVETRDFGSNPGKLRMLGLPPSGGHPVPLVVVLHGCTQTAAGYAESAGWRALAERHGFALLCPEQRPENNPKSCFSWFQPADVGREGGECQSIRQMVERMLADHPIDAGRVYVTGLSAGGAMAAAMLATAPELFAGGTIVAGLPHGAASTVQGAFEAMFQGVTRPAAERGEAVRRAAGRPRGAAARWPQVLIWQGEADTTVVPANADELVKQWTDVHGLPLQPTLTETRGKVTRSEWLDASGRLAVQLSRVAGLAHGQPIALSGPDRCGRVSQFVFDAGVSAAVESARTWELLAPAGVRETEPRRPTAGAASHAGAESGKMNDSGKVIDLVRPQARARPRPSTTGDFIADTINRALAAAGLTKR